MLDSLTLDRRLRLGLEVLGHTDATEVQEAVIPDALEGRDLLISAETGSGKTLCYLLPIAQQILTAQDTSASGTLALVLVPTRELARQVVKEARKLLRKTNLAAQAITGGADLKYQKALLRKDPEILVATPGRLRELCELGAAHLGILQTLVLDEADRMLDMGLREDVLTIGEHCNSERQTIMLSATLKHTGVAVTARALLRHPKSITVGSVRQAHSNISHQLILADSGEHKDKLLAALVQEHPKERLLVFVNKRLSADRLASRLNNRDASVNGGESPRAASLHGDMSTEARKRVVAQFQDGRVQVLCASDVAARGLDVPGIELIINYDMPRSGDDYLHRSGRTGRAGQAGTTLSLVSATEWNLMISIQRYLNIEFERIAIPGLKARYNGPRKQKTSGKASGTKKKKRKNAGKVKSSSTQARAKPGKRAGTDKGGKRRQQSTTPGKQKTQRPAGESQIDGFAPLTRKPTGRPDK